MIYLYGLLSPDATGAEEKAEALKGVTDTVLTEPLPEGILIYGPSEASEILAKRRYLLAHARVLESFLELGALLPMRFGMVTSSVAAVSELIAAQAEAVRAQMDRLSGLVEVGLRISYDRDAALQYQLVRHPVLEAERVRLMTPSGGGHFEQAAFGRRLSEALDQHRTETQKVLVRALKPAVDDLILKSPESDVQVLAADLLVSREEVERLSDTVLSLLETVDFGGSSEPEVRLIGPEPPFNFVQINLDAIAEPA